MDSSVLLSSAHEILRTGATSNSSFPPSLSSLHASTEIFDRSLSLLPSPIRGSPMSPSAIKCTNLSSSLSKNPGSRL